MLGNTRPLFNNAENSGASKSGKYHSSCLSVQIQCTSMYVIVLRKYASILRKLAWNFNFTLFSRISYQSSHSQLFQQPLHFVTIMSEHDPLLGRNSLTPPHHQTEKTTRWKISLFPTFTTISPKYRWVPLIGCTLIFINEAEYFIKQVATMRAIESMYCYNFYLAQGSDLVKLGKHIPEHLCKNVGIQKDLAKTAGLYMFVRMLSAMVGAVPLGFVADRWGRKVVIVMHKVNVVFSCAAWLGICGYILLSLHCIWLIGNRFCVPQSPDMDIISFWFSWTLWW